MDPGARAKTCLVVDDSRVMRLMAAGIMVNLGFTVQEAEDGMSAVALCEKRIPDLVLLDWHMPVMNGMQFMEALRKLPGGADACVVFCTTENDVDNIRSAVASSANEYVMKPFDRDILNRKLTRLGMIP